MSNIFQKINATEYTKAKRDHSFNTLLSKCVGKVQQLHNLDGKIIGLNTGFKALDRKLFGLKKSNLILLAGQSSMDKTGFALNIARNISICGRKSVAIFSMGKRAEDLTMRMMFSQGKIDRHLMNTGDLNEEEWARLMASVTSMSDAKLFIDDTPRFSFSELCDKTKQIKHEHGLDLVIIDNLQQLRSNSYFEHKNRSTADTAWSLKVLAKELDIPIIVLSQLNRTVDSRTDKRPLLRDIPSFREIEQVVDSILFIYRDCVYNPDSASDTAEIIIRKGQIGTINLSYSGRYSCFEDLEKTD